MIELIALVIALFATFAFEWLLWNNVLIVLFTAIPAVTYWQMAGLHILVRLLFETRVHKNKE